MNRQTPRKDLRASEGADVERANALPPWTIVQLIDTNEVCAIRSDLQDVADPRVTVQFIDKTGRTLKGNTQVRVLANHSDVMYAHMRLLELSLAPSTEQDNPLHALVAALGEMNRDMEHRPGAYLKAGVALDNLLSAVRALTATVVMPPTDEVLNHA